MRIKAFTCLVVLLLALGMATPAVQAAKKPNILVIWGDDIGYWKVSHNNRGMMGYKTPNIDRIANEGLSFTDYYAEQSCAAKWPLCGTTISRCISWSRKPMVSTFGRTRTLPWDGRPW